MAMTFTKGQVIRVRLAGTSDEWCPGTVAVASGNGISVGLWLDDAVRTSNGSFIAGSLPLFFDEQKVRSIFGDEYEIEDPNAG
jgi:hypothetical protein